MTTCRTCTFHGEASASAPGYAECRRMPPTHARMVGAGLALAYGLTADDLPACGEYKAGAGDPAEALEAKAPAPQSNRRDRRR
ncbi:hypothetical protein [Singulisphaera sp. PoT]|uniref:hypothetical protein n=1 Tax=Singulisphaera sp. PoT TaxID=3411797 RepID=UPI003BF4B094